MPFRDRIVEWEDSDGRIHTGTPTPNQIDGSKAIKVEFTNTEDEKDKRYYIVRHPTNFRTLKRTIFDIKLTAERYGIELVHA